MQEFSYERVTNTPFDVSTRKILSMGQYHLFCIEGHRQAQAFLDILHKYAFAGE